MNTIVIGGGPAGMMAAIEAARNSEVLLLEGNASLGKKLLLTGGGRCNLTSAQEPDDFLQRIHNARFFRPSLQAFSQEDLVHFFEARGLKLKREGLKWYPVTDQAQSVLEILITAMKQAGVQVLTKRKVTGLRLQDHDYRVITADETYQANRLILACGGASFSATGSDGGMLDLLRREGLEVTPLEAGLTALYLENPFSSLSGISLPDAALRFGKKSARGEMLFTHHGLSGPLVIDLSSDLHPFPLEMTLDFLPESKDEELLERLFHSDRRTLSTVLAEELPRRVAQFLMEPFEQGDRFNFERSRRRQVIECIKRFKVLAVRKGTLKEAMVTVGGVDVKQLSPATLEHRKHRGLYMAGEMLDLHGPSGGYNLQIAFSTGYLAGRSIK